jgi:hypothetical protein
MGNLVSREQVVWLATVAAVFQVLTSYGFDVSGHVQGIATAVVVFVFAVANAIHVHDGIVALVTGILNALFALFAAFNLDWTAGHQTLIVGAVTAVLGLFVRTQVTAPVPATVSPAGVLVASKAPAQ